MARPLYLAFVVALTACHAAPKSATPAPASTPSIPAPPTPASKETTTSTASNEHSSERPGAPEKPYVPKASCPLPPRAPLAVVDAAGSRATGVPVDPMGDVDESVEDHARATAALELFDTALDAARYDEALACAQVVSRLSPDSPIGHLDRALALDSIGQTPGAHQAYERAVSLAPDDPDVLLAAADFLERVGDDDALETAVIYARRGRDNAPAAQGAQLAAVESRSLNDLGRPDEALKAAESSLALDSDGADAQIERGVALFESLQFDEAGKVLSAIHAKDPKNARIDWHLGLLAERQGKASESDALIADAVKLDPDTYPPPLEVTPAEFQKVIDEEVKKLPDTARKDLAATKFSWIDLPETEDLASGDPVLSPEIVGVFRPGEEGQQDSILLYRKNLLRVAHTPEELRNEVRDTLLHELGHFRGEDDEELRDRGL